MREVEVETEIDYTTERDAAMEPWGQDANSPILKQAYYRYRLELNAKGEIIGGNWISQERPDFLWNMSKPRFTSDFKTIEELYEASQR